MTDTYATRIYKGKPVRERKTGRGNKGNEKYLELCRLEKEWRKKHNLR